MEVCEGEGRKKRGGKEDPVCEVWSEQWLELSGESRGER